MPKYVLQEMPDLGNEGKRKVYPKLDSCRLIETEEFVKIVHSYQRAIAPSVVSAVLSEVAATLKRKLSEGYTVKLDDLGVFSLSLAFNDQKPTEMESDTDRMLHRKVVVSNVNFKADANLLKNLRYDTELERKVGGVKLLRSSSYTREERIARALTLIERNGFITLREYAALNGMSRTMASGDLKEICKDHATPIVSSGSGSHKVWVRRPLSEGTE